MAEQEYSPTLPQGGLPYALIGGGIAGLLCIVQNVAITLADSSTFQVAKAGNLTTNEAIVLVGLAAVPLLISLAIFAITGFIIGRITIRRRLGFLAGAIAGAIVYLGSFVVRYIPNYPGNLSTSGTTHADVRGIVGGIVLSIVFLLMWAAMGGFVSRLGARIATRRHPYYNSSPTEQ